MPTLITGAVVRTHRGIVGDAVLVEGGVVAAVGEAAALRAAGIEEIGFDDAVIIPGLRDAHFHPVAYTAAVTGLTLDSAADIAAVLEAVSTRAAALEPGRAVVGLRLDNESLAEQRLPTATELSSVAGDRPVMLHRYCGHVAVANEAALALAGIDATTPDPAGGVIDRDAAGNPTGGLRETAIDLVSEALATTTAPAVAPSDVEKAVGGLGALGVTTIGAIVRCGEGAWATLGDETDLLAAAAPRIPVKARCYVIADTAEEFAAAGAQLDRSGPRVRWQGLKRFGDGSFGGHTAAMHEPFHDRDTVGTLRLDATDDLMVRTALRAGKDVAVHAIGDLAVTRVIDLFERTETIRGDAVLRIEHVSVIQPADVARMSRLGVIGSVQPPFLGSETGWLEDRVGPDRLPLTYAFRTMIDAGVRLAGGSDCPVEKPDPWSGMALARDRAGIHPAESLSAGEAFALYTSGGAAALGEPEPLAVGSPADIAVVDRDPVTATPDELRETRVLATFVDGEQLDISAGPMPWPG